MEIVKCCGVCEYATYITKKSRTISCALTEKLYSQFTKPCDNYLENTDRVHRIINYVYNER